MLPLHTQKSLDALPWNEIQKIHSSLGLKATAATRTRRDYQRRIVAAMPQPVVEPEAVATPLTCATCPLARRLDNDDNRYCCGLTSRVTRGHWEANFDCYDAVAAQAEVGVTEPAAEVGAPIAQSKQTPAAATTTTEDAPPNRGDNGRGRVTALTVLPEATIVLPHATKPKADDNFMSSMVKENAFDKAFYDMTYLLEQQLKAQLAVERTVIGSEDEAIALMHLKKIDEDIEYYDRPVIEPQPSLIVVQLENQMKELKADTLKLFKIEPFDQSILPTETDEPEQSATQSEPEPEGTIHWMTPLRGVIVGKKGATRQFYIRNDEIFIVLSGDFTASETKHPNVRHAQIREAINLGRTFNPRIFKISPNFERDTQACNGGRIRQECDGRWWAWADDGITGQPFLSENLATQYLDRIAASKQAQKQISCVN